MSRRKLKEDRELIADIDKRAKLFCDAVYDDGIKGCHNCPLLIYEEADCRIAYVKYILAKENL